MNAANQAEEPTKQRLDVLMQEKEYRQSEMLDYNKRLDHTVVLYLSAAYAAIGLQVSGKLDLSLGLTSDRYVIIVFLFVFLNGCIILHALSQMVWCMSVAQYIHIRLDTEILKLLREKYRQDDANQKLRHIHWLAWDDWRAGLKGVANGTRGAVTALWIVFVLFGSIYSLSFANIPRFAVANPTIFVIGALIAIGIYSYASYEAIRLAILMHGYHSGHEDFVVAKYRWLALRHRWLTFIPAAILITLGVWAARTNSSEEPYGRQPSDDAGICGEKSASAQPRDEAVRTCHGN